MGAIENKKGGWTVPWIHAEEWEAMIQSVRDCCDALGENKSEAMACVAEIAELYNELEEPLDLLCSATCPICENVCCLRATVWYDRKDLIFFYLAEGRFPDRQVSRNGKGQCCHLRSQGCKLPRSKRPFICTWYLCTPQMEILKQRGITVDGDIQGAIEKIKALRNRLSFLCQPNK